MTTHEEVKATTDPRGPLFGEPFPALETSDVMDYQAALNTTPKRSHGKLLLAGGVLGLVCVAFVVAIPEWGALSALGGTLAGIGSAGMTLLARK